jgi:hypothetical protein
MEFSVNAVPEVAALAVAAVVAAAAGAAAADAEAADAAGRNRISASIGGLDLLTAA